MTAKEARTHLRYSTWASRKVMDAARNLKPEDLAHANGVSHGSILGTLVHTHFADRIWYSRVVDPAEEVIRECDWATLEQRWPEIQRKWETWADSLGDQDLDRAVEYKGTFDGLLYQNPVSHI